LPSVAAAEPSSGQVCFEAPQLTGVYAGTDPVTVTDIGALIVDANINLRINGLRVTVIARRCGADRVVGPPPDSGSAAVGAAWKRPAT
jgi:hypothetical protein